MPFLSSIKRILREKTFLVLRLSLIAIIILSLGYKPQFSGTAAPTLTIAPISWNVVGLDSNDVLTGPNPRLQYRSGSGRESHRDFCLR